MNRLPLAFLLLAVVPCVADDPQVKLPVCPVEVDPEPPRPTQVTALHADQLYVIEAEVPCIVLASREGFVRISADEGPLKIRSKFAGGEDAPETRMFVAKHIYSIEATKKGEVEILIIPAGSVETSDVIRRTLSVMGGEGPRPPPDPFEEEKDPPAPPMPKATHVTLAIVEDVKNRTAESALIFNALPGWDLRKDGHDWIIYDKDTREAQGVKIVAALNGMSLPAFALLDKDSGAVIHVGPLPADLPALQFIVEEAIR